MASAIQLLTCREDGKFEVGKEAEEALRRITGPVGVVTVCGRARQGKSFLLNQLLGRSTGFQVAPTQRPCTKGLWLWSDPVPMTSPDGSKFSMVLVDTEGIDAYDQTGTYSIQIFSISLLLSSLFIYNQMGGIDEAALERLQLIVEMTKHIRVRAGRGSTNELAQYTPTFFWLLRDFYLDLSDVSGKTITPRDYLEAALSPVAGSGHAVEAKNTIRESIKTLFPDRDCFALMRPADDEHILRNLDSVPFEQLRPQFLSGLRYFTQRVFSSVEPRKINNCEMSGAAVATMLHCFVDAINNGAVPTISTAWQNVVEMECRRATEVAETAYRNAFDTSRLPPDEAALSAAHTKAMKIAQGVFEDTAVGDGEGRRKHERRFLEKVNEHFSDLRERKMAEAEALCTSALAAAGERLQSMADDPMTHGGVTQLISEIDGLMSAISASAAGGPQRYKNLVKYLQDNLARLVTTAAAHERDAAAREARLEAQAAAAAAAKEAAVAYEAAITAAEQRGRAEAEQRALEEWRNVITAAEASATQAAEEAYLGMLCDFVDRIGPGNGRLEGAPANTASPSLSVNTAGSRSLDMKGIADNASVTRPKTGEHSVAGSEVSSPTTSKLPDPSVTAGPLS